MAIFLTPGDAADIHNYWGRIRSIEQIQQVLILHFPAPPAGVDSILDLLYLCDCNLHLDKQNTAHTTTGGCCQDNFGNAKSIRPPSKTIGTSPSGPSLVRSDLFDRSCAYAIVGTLVQNVCDSFEQRDVLVLCRRHALLPC